MQKETIESLEKTLSLFEKQNQTIETINDTENKIINVIIILNRRISIIIFLLIIIIYYLFFFKYLDNLLIKVSVIWLRLPEGYKILFLGLLGSIPAQIISSLFTIKIQKYLTFNK